MRRRPADYRHLVLCAILVASAIATGLATTDVARSMSPKGLDYPHADRLVTLVAGSKSWSPAMLEIAGAIDVFEKLSGIQERSATIQFTGQAELVRLESVSSTYFELLGVKPAVGRLFLQEEDRRNSAIPVAVISHGLWRRRFGGDPSALGQGVNIDGRRLEIIGILREESTGLIGRTDVWVPLGSARWLSGDEEPERASSRWFEVFGLLKPGLDVAAATRRFAAEMPAAMAAAGLPADLAGSPQRLAVAPLSDVRVPPIGRRAAPILNWAAASLCLFVLITVSSMLFLRAHQRSHDAGVRIALGATLPHLLRPAIVEAFLITALSTALAMAIRPVLTGALGAIRPSSTSFGIVTAEWLRAAPVFSAATLFIAVTTLFALTTVSILSTLAAVRRARVLSMRAAPAIEGLSRLGTPAVWLVSAQAGLACMVVAGGLLMTTAVAQVLGDDRGYASTDVWTARMTLPGDYDVKRAASFLTRLGERLSSIPGIDAVSFATCAPGAGRCRQSNISGVDGVPLSRHIAPQIGIHIVSPGHFRTIGAQLTRGRDLELADSSSAAKAVVITDTLAERLWPGAVPIGHQLEVYTANGSLAGFRTVVGTIRPVRFNVDDDAGLDVYLPVSQASAASLVAFTKGKLPARDRTAALASETAALDSRIPIYDPASLEARLASSLATEQLIERALMGFGAVALLLAWLSVHTLTSQAVSNGRRELAVRMALGATTRSIRFLVARRAMVIATLGSVAGTATAFFGSRMLRTMLHGMPNDHWVLFLAPVVTALALAIATIWPIRRASRVNVLMAMRVD